MFGKKKVIKVILLAIAISSLVVSPIFAQDEIDPAVEPEQVEEQSKFFGSKIVQLIADFFADLINPPQEDPVVEEPDGSGEPPADPGSTEGDPPEGEPTEEADPTPELEPTPVPAAVVAAMKEEDKLGYGEIVKLLDIASNAAAVCEETGEFCDVTYESIVDEYKAGTGMGALFKKYGKPAHLGVGHIKEPKEKKPKKNK